MTGSNAAPQTAEKQQRWFWSLVIFSVALAVRTVHLWQIRLAPFFPLKIGDAESYDAWARQIASGNWLGDSVFYQAPLYPYFLGMVYRLLGDDPMTVRKCQAVLAACSCVLLAHAAWNLFSRRAGVLAGLGLALYAPAIFLESLVQKPVLDEFFVCLALWLLSWLVSDPCPWGWLWLGVTLGGLALTRENALILVVPLLLWIAWGQWQQRANGRQLRARLGWAAMFVTGLLAVLIPVALRNKLVGGELHLTTAQLGPNLYIGNNPQADGTYRPLRYGRGHPRYEQADAVALAEAAVGRRLSPGEVSAYWTRRALGYACSQPLHWLGLMAKKAALLCNAIEVTDSEDQYTYAQWSLPLRLTGWLLHFGVLGPLACLGLFVTWDQRRKLWVFYAMLFTLAASVIVFYVFARYRFPLVPFLILFAAGGLDRLPAWSRGISRRRVAAAMAAVVLVSLWCNWPLVAIGPMQATTASNIGNGLARCGRLDEAIEQYRRALAIQPDHALAHNNLAVVLMQEGKREEAIRHLRAALAIEPGYENARKNLRRALRLSSARTSRQKQRSETATSLPGSRAASQLPP